MSGSNPVPGAKPVPEPDLGGYQYRIVVFDGVCNFCNGAVRFIARRDPDRKFRFAPMQSRLGQALLFQFRIEEATIDTFLLIRDGKAHVYSDAALCIARELTGYWYLFTVLRIVPVGIRDYLYRLFARNRYRLFGRKPRCAIPEKGLIERFIDTKPENS